MPLQAGIDQHALPAPVDVELDPLAARLERHGDGPPSRRVGPGGGHPEARAPGLVAELDQRAVLGQGRPLDLPRRGRPLGEGQALVEQQPLLVALPGGRPVRRAAGDGVRHGRAPARALPGGTDLAHPRLEAARRGHADRAVAVSGQRHPHARARILRHREAVGRVRERARPSEDGRGLPGELLVEARGVGRRMRAAADQQRRERDRAPSESAAPSPRSSSPHPHRDDEAGEQGRRRAAPGRGPPDRAARVVAGRLVGGRDALAVGGRRPIRPRTRRRTGSARCTPRRPARSGRARSRRARATRAGRARPCWRRRRRPRRGWRRCSGSPRTASPRPRRCTPPPARRC